MAKKMSRGGKQILSLIFHLVVLYFMVHLYDTARAMLNKDTPKPASTGKIATGESVPVAKPKGTSMEELMAAKQRKDKEKAEKTAPQKK